MFVATALGPWYTQKKLKLGFRSRAQVAEWAVQQLGENDVPNSG